MSIFRKATIVLLLAALPIAAMAQERTVRIGHNRAWNCVPLILGITEGYFKNAGINVVERAFNNPADIVQAIAAGDLDGGVAPSGMLFTALPRGVGIRGVALAQGGQYPPVTFMVRTDSGIKGPADLKGRTVAIAGFGGTTDLMMRYWLTQGGVDPKADLKITFTPYHLMLPSLVNKQIAAAPIDPLLAIRAKQEFPGQVQKLFDYEDVTQKVLGNDHVNGLLLTMGTAFIERDRETAVRFMEGYLRATRSTKGDMKKTLAAWSAASKNEAILHLDKLPSMPEDGKIFLDAFQFEADLAHKFGYVSAPVDVKKAVDHSLLEEAARRLK
jgi:ABC-type nitrate/sulfonate/bicarbonate transport system substrate-binding protein